VHFRLDDARLLEVTMTIHSTAAAADTVTIRGSMFDKSGKLVGDVSGGQLNVQPGSDGQIRLTGPNPNGTIASATFEVSTVPAATPAGG
jgi:hypothetical protein